MITFQTTLQKFEKNKEKTGWTYIEISPSQANKMMPGQRVSFRVKGSIDSYSLQKTALLPSGEGSFILPVNGTIRKAIGKKHGDKVKVVLEVDKRKLEISSDLMTSLRDEPGAMAYFRSLPKSHQNYFSKWIEDAKTTGTKTKRIVMAVIAMSKKQDFGQMIRESRKEML